MNGRKLPPAVLDVVRVAAVVACGIATVGVAAGASQPAASTPISVSFPTPVAGFVATSDGALIASDDGGRRWRRVHRGLAFDTIRFASRRTGFGLAGSVLYRSDDGGRSWRRVHAFVRGRPVGHGGPKMSFLDAERGWVSPLGQLIYRTKDGGRRWFPLRFGCDVYVAGVSLVDRDRAVVVCGGHASGRVQGRDYFATADAADTWERTDGGVFEGYASGVEHVSVSVGFLSATRRGIERVETHRLVPPPGDRDKVLSMWWPDERHGFAVLERRGLVATSDGGRRWRRIPVP